MVETKRLDFENFIDVFAIEIGKKIGFIDSLPDNEALVSREDLIRNMLTFAANLGIYEKARRPTRKLINNSYTLSDDIFDRDLRELILIYGNKYLQ